MVRCYYQIKCAAVLLVIFLLLTAVSVYAQEIQVKQSQRYTELLVQVHKDTVKNYSQDDSSITVNFTKKLKDPFRQELTDKYITAIEGKGEALTVFFSKGTDFAVFTDDEGIRFIGANPKEVSNVLLSYGLDAPLLRKKDKKNEDPVSEAILREADNLTSRGDYYGAISKLDVLSEDDNSPYYQQEALFRVGDIYMLMGQTDYDAYYSAALAMDKLIKLYPDSSRLHQAQKTSALAKELGGQTLEAIQTYFDIFDTTSLDAETRRTALQKVASLYQSIGQYDKAIDAYSLYLNNFKTDSEDVRSKLGKLYLMQGRKNEAFDFFDNSTVKEMTSSLTREQLITLAAILDEKGENKKAFDLYTYIVKSRDPELEDDFNDKLITAQAIYRMAQMYKEFGDEDAYSKELTQLMELAPDTTFGQLAFIEYAELNYKTKKASDWQTFLAPVYNNDDSRDLKQRADMVIIESLLNDKNYPDLIKKIDAYITDYPSAEDNERLLKEKENALFVLGQQAQAGNNGQLAIKYYKSLLMDYPESSMVTQVNQFIDDINFNEAKALFDGGDYKKTKETVENYILTNGKPGSRWYDLWDDSAYNIILTGIGVEDSKIIRFKCREYLAETETGKYKEPVEDILVESFRYPFFAAASNADNANVIDMFDENKEWLASWKDQELYNNAKIETATAYLNMGLSGKAGELFPLIVPMMTNEYAVLGYSLCKNILFDINNLSESEFNTVIDNAEKCSSDLPIALSYKYTKNIKISLQKQYELSKSVSSEKERESIISRIYNEVLNNPQARFNGYEDVYYDAAMQAYRKNDYAKSLPIFKAYVDLVKEPTEKKAEAIYYMAKIMENMGQPQQSMKYYEMLVNNMPDSIYRNMAKSEMEDYNWRKSLTK